MIGTNQLFGIIAAGFAGTLMLLFSMVSDNHNLIRGEVAKLHAHVYAVESDLREEIVLAEQRYRELMRHHHAVPGEAPR